MTRDTYRPKTPPKGIAQQIASPVEETWEEDPTGQKDLSERARLRSMRDPDVRFAHIEERLDAIAEQRTERFDRIDHGIDRVGERLDGYAERVVRAESKGDQAWKAVIDLGPKLEGVLAIGGDVKRLADGMDRLNARADVQDKRISAVETDQRLTDQALEAVADKFKTSDQRVGKIEHSLGRLTDRVVTLETAKAVDDNTAKARKLVARERPWWFTSKGTKIVIAAIAAAIIGIMGAAGKC